MRRLIVLLGIFAICAPAIADAPEPETQNDKAPTVTLSATDEKASEILDQICKQTGARILMEKTADVKVSVSVSDIPIEDALTAICKGGDLTWRKIYLRADSLLLKQPEALASTVRLITGMQFPDLVIDSASTGENVIYSRLKPAVDAVPVSLRRNMGMVPLYLIANDKAAREVKEKPESRVEKYAKLMQETMKLFMEMTPEEREQAMAMGLQQVQQFDPNYMAEVTKSALQNPGFMQQASQAGMNMLFSMSPEDRRAIMRMQMEMQQYITPEQRQMLMEDAKAVMAELGITQPPQQ